MVTPTGKKDAVAAMVKDHGLSERRACGLVGAHRSTCRYRSHRRDDAEFRRELRELAAKHPRYGYDRLWRKLRRRGVGVNRKRVYRVYKLENLAVRRKTRRKLCSTLRAPLAKPQRPNERWSMDFMRDTTSDGRPFRLLNVLDECTREWLAIDVGRSLPASRVVWTLECLRETRGLPEVIVVDNGTEFTSKALDQWSTLHGVRLHFIQPGKPTQNAFIESHNGKVRDECLDMSWFADIDEARTEIERHRIDYNEDRLHSGIGHMTPNEYLRKFAEFESPQAALT